LTISDDLRGQAARLEDQAAELRAIAATLEGESTPVLQPALTVEPPSGKPKDRYVGISAAANITKLSESSLYRMARLYGVGWRLPTGGWKFSEARLRRYLRGDMPDGGFGDPGGFDEGRGIDAASVTAHHHKEER
jgi:hypothetical protein